MLRLIAILSTACIVSNGCSSKRSKPPADFPEDNGAKSESSAVGSGETTTAASKTTVPKNARLIVLNWQPSPQLTRRLSEHDTMFGTLAIETPSDAPTLRLRVKVERLSADVIAWANQQPHYVDLPCIGGMHRTVRRISCNRQHGFGIKFDEGQELGTLLGFDASRAKQLTEKQLEFLAKEPSLKELQLSRAEIDASGLALIAEIDGLEFLALGWIKLEESFIARIGQMESLRSLDLRKTGIATTSVASLATLRNLESLNLSYNDKLDAQVFDELAKLPALRELEIKGLDLFGSVAGLGKLTGLEYLSIDLLETAPLAKLKNLRSLHLEMGLCKNCLRPLATLDKLESLTLRGQFAPSGFAQLDGLKRLRRLDVSYVGLTDDGFAPLVELGLEQLNLANTQITDESLAALASKAKPTLRYLNLTGTRVTDVGIKHLAKISSLEALDLHGTQITDAAVAEVAKLKSLRSLSLVKTSISNAAADHLGELTALTFLNLNHTKVGDEILSTLKKLPKLRQFRVSSSNVSFDACYEFNEKAGREICDS